MMLFREATKIRSEWRGAQLPEESGEAKKNNIDSDSIHSIDSFFAQKTYSYEQRNNTYYR